MQSRLCAAFSVAALFAGCSGGSPSLPSSGSPALAASANLQKPTLKAATSGVINAKSLYVSDAGAIKIYSASASGNAPYTKLLMPNDFNNPGRGEFAVTQGTTGVNVYYADEQNGTLVWCRQTRHYVENFHYDSCDTQGTIVDAADISVVNPAWGDDVVWNAETSSLVLYNGDNGGLATYNTAAFSYPIANPPVHVFTGWANSKIAVEPLSGDIWIVNADIPWKLDRASLQAISQGIRVTVGDDVPYAFDENANFQFWYIGLNQNLYGTAIGGAQVTETLNASPISGLSCGVATDNGWVYAVVNTTIAIYSDSTTAWDTQPARTITGLTGGNGADITIL